MNRRLDAKSGQLAALIGLLMVVLVACGTRKLVRPTPEGAKVVVGTGTRPEGLKYIGDVEGSDGSGAGLYGTPGTRTTALNELKNRAAAMGATYVLIIQEKEPGSGLATEYPKYRIRGEAYGPGGHDNDTEEPATGTAGGECYGNGTCNEGLNCADGRCASASPSGTEGGPCYGNGTCNDGFSCADGICFVADNGPDVQSNDAGTDPR